MAAHARACEIASKVRLGRCDAAAAAAAAADLEHGEQSADIAHAQQSRHKALDIERLKIIDVLSRSDENDGRLRGGNGGQSTATWKFNAAAAE